MLANGLNHLNPTDVEKKPIISEAGKNNKSDKNNYLPILTLKNNPLLRNWVYFLNVFILGGPRGFRQKKLQNLDSLQSTEMGLLDKSDEPATFNGFKN
jgi:hypothetical protein